MNKIAIYTAIFGDKDTLKEPIKFEGVDYYCFTDNKEVKSDIYQIKLYDPIFSDPTRSAKIFKILPNVFLPEYEYTIWIDGSIETKPGFIKLLDYLREGDIVMFKHSHRDCVYDEAAACVKRNKDNHLLIKQQIKYYYKEGYPKNNGLNMAGIIVRRNHSGDVVKFNEAWWEQIQKFSRRDQLSLNFVAWKNNINIITVPVDEENNEFFLLAKHKKINRELVPDRDPKQVEIENSRAKELIAGKHTRVLNNKKVIYTAIFGKIDELIEPEGEYRDFDFICFTDRSNFKSKRYKIIKVKRFFDDPALEARMYKILPHLFLPQYDFSIWIDGRVIIKKKDLSPLFKTIEKANLAVFPHMYRDCIYEEAKACIYRRKDNPIKIINQITNYAKEGYPINNGGVETGVLIRKHMQKDTIEFQNSWWKEIIKFSKRDQISFNYVAWKNNFKFNYIKGHVWDNKYFEVLPLHASDLRKKLTQ